MEEAADTDIMENAPFLVFGGSRGAEYEDNQKKRKRDGIRFK